MSIFRDGSITVVTSSDKLRGMLSISAAEAEYPSAASIFAALKQAGINYGIDESYVLAISEEKKRVSEVTIAAGSPAQGGNPARLEWHIDIGNDRSAISRSGRADLKNMNHFERVKAGTILATKVSSWGSTKGVLVTGEKVESLIEGDEIAMPTGKNVSLSKDGNSLIADISGYANFRLGLINVDLVFHVKGDVDMKTGNINYDGAIMIDGDVRSGFRVEASDSIYINGTVEGAEVYSRNGSIIIQRGILGRNQARILARDELRCGFIQDANASAKNDIIIEHYAINSQITSGGVIHLVQNEGLLRGGKLIADLGIEVLEAGSQRNMPTEMVLSQSDQKSGNEQLQSLQKELGERQQSQISLGRRKQFLELLKKQLNSISEPRVKELIDINSQIDSNVDRIKKIKQDISSLHVEEANNKKNFAILVHNKLYRKVTFTIGYKQYINEAVRSGVSVQKKGDGLKISPLA